MVAIWLMRWILIPALRSNNLKSIEVCHSSQFLPVRCLTASLRVQEKLGYYELGS